MKKLNMADFAKSQLMKYGWTEGKGLGKNETGITEALKPKFKFDVAGIGHKDDDSNNWWESAFNKAADNIVVESQTHGVLISVSKKSTNKVFGAKKSKHEASYGRFLKTSVLLHGNVINQSHSNAPKVEKKIVEDVTHIPLTDEQLFKVCGGRTAHKGARHGLTLNGKLQRIARQEENLLATNTLEKHKKYQERECEIDNNENTLLPVSLSPFRQQTPRQVSKSVRKKTKRRINDLTHQLNVRCNVSDNDERSKQSASDDGITKKELKLKRKRTEKGRKGPLACDVEVVEKEEGDKEIEDASFPVSAKFENEIIEKRVQGKLSDHGGEVFENVSAHEKKKKSRRKKDENYQDGNIINICEDVNLGSSRTKKYKISRRSDRNLQPLTEEEEEEDDFNTIENKFKAKISRVQPFTESRQVGDSSVKYLKNEADRLNARIMKKKKTKHYRKQKIRLDKITESLEAVHFDTEKSTHRKTAKKKLDTLVEAMIETSIAIDKTECLRKTEENKKKKKKKKKK